MNLDESTIEKRLNSLAKTDDNILSQSYALSTGAQLNSIIAKLHAGSINDFIQQDDELEKCTLQYEGSVSTTALAFSRFHEIAIEDGTSFKFNLKQLIKFSSYFSTKR